MGLTTTTHSREVAFLSRHPEYAMQGICMYYPLSIQLLRKYRESLNWEFIWANRSIAWTEELIAEFLDYLLVNGKFDYEFSNNPTLPWSSRFIKRQEGRWDTQGIEENETLNPSTAQPISIVRAIMDLNDIRSKKEQLDWSLISAGDANLSWEINLLEEFESFLDFGVLYYNQDAWMTSFASLTEQEIQNLILTCSNASTDIESV